MTAETITEPDCADLAQRARLAYTEAQALTAHVAMRRRREQVENIYRALAKLDITPADQSPAFINAASGQICVPLIVGELRIETGEGDAEGYDYPVQTHAVAAEWDPDEGMVLLVADTDYDDYGYKDDGRWLYPAGYVHTLASLGEAIERGGRKPAAQATGQSEAARILGAVNGDLIDAHGAVMLAAAEAVCAALADVTAAVRAGNRP